MLMLGRHFLAALLLGRLAAMVIHETLLPRDIVLPVLPQCGLFLGHTVRLLLGRLWLRRLVGRGRRWVSW